MKTTKFFFLMAAMLLTSVCAMAQSNDTTPLKGDVNEDGTVDVADLVAVMTIMRDGGGAVGEKMCYWYAGVNNGNAVTDENFINIASRIAESQIPEAGSVTATGQYIYIVMPETRHLSSLTDGNGAAVEYDCTDVFGYHIYKTSEKVNGTFNYAIAETIYYWYVGTEAITSSSTPGSGTVTTDETALGWHNISGTPTEIQVGPTARQLNNVVWYIAIPDTLGITKATSGGLTDGAVTSTTMTLSDGVVYRVFTTSEMKKVDYLMAK